MSDSTAAILTTIPILVIGGVVWTVYCKRQRRRRHNFVRAAEELALRSHPPYEEVLVGAMESMPDFGRRFDGKLINVLWKNLGSTNLATFEFRPQGLEGIRRDRNYRVWHSGFYLHSSGLDLPGFLLRSRGLLDKVGALFKWPDVDFTGHPEFAERFSLKGEDSDRLATLFDEKLVSFFESRIRPPDKIGIPGLYYQREHPLPSVEAKGDGFLYLPNRLIAPDELSSFVQDLQTLFELLGGSVATTGAELAPR